MFWTINGRQDLAIKEQKKKHINKQTITTTMLIRSEMVTFLLPCCKKFPLFPSINPITLGETTLRGNEKKIARWQGFFQAYNVPSLQHGKANAAKKKGEN